MKYRGRDLFVIQQMFYLLHKLNLNDEVESTLGYYCGYCADQIPWDNTDTKFCSARCRNAHYE